MPIKMKSKETTTPKLCKLCGNKYVREYCDFCKRKARWNPEKHIQSFTPRLQLDLKELKIKVIPSDVEALSLGLGLYITGPVGCGKTLYAANLMLSSIRSTYINQKGPKSHAFLTTSDLLEKIKKTYDAEEPTTDVVRLYSEVDFLILDDVGVEKLTDWSLEKLYQIINYRYEFLKPTIFTSNLALSELASTTGDRIPSRIKKMTRTKRLRAIDYRLVI